jgi:hypothetical protein
VVTVELRGEGISDSGEPPGFDLLSPENGAYVEEPVLLTWQALQVSDPVTYIVYVAMGDSSRPPGPLTYDAGDQTSFSIPIGDLSPNAIHVWWVIAHWGTAAIRSESEWTFMLGIPPPPIPHFSLLSPTDNAMITNETQLFEWEAIEGNPSEPPVTFVLDIILRTNDSLNGEYYHYEVGAQTSYTVDMNELRVDNDYVWYVTATAGAWGDLMSDQAWRFHLSQFGHPNAVEELNRVSSASRFGIRSIYPNPFNPETSITLIIPETGVVRAQVFDILGREVATLLNGKISTGEHRLTWRAAGASGLYLLRVSNERGEVDVRKLTVTK